ncbi:MAG: hypothetical protein K2N34_07465 [Lachnospiraceae bacterium]|nr:hypothetical protein [Lachnospiraceae bacterium]
MRIEDLTWLIGTGGVILTILIQKLSSKYKPWSWLAEQLGKAINKEMLDKLTELEKKVDKLEETDKKQDEERAEEKALEARRRILRFADECRRHEKHSEEYFNNILEDISMYKDYCLEHPLFENEKAALATTLIEDIYKHCYENDDFL